LKYALYIDRNVTDGANQYVHPSHADADCVARSKLPAIIAAVIPHIYLKLSSCKWTNSEQLK